MIVELDDLSLEDLIQTAMNRLVAIQGGPESSAEYATVAQRLELVSWALQAARVAPPANPPPA